MCLCVYLCPDLCACAVQAFDRVIYAVHTAAIDAVLRRFAHRARVLATQTFTKRLLATSMAMFADIPSAPLLDHPLLCTTVRHRRIEAAAWWLTGSSSTGARRCWWCCSP